MEQNRAGFFRSSTKFPEDVSVCWLMVYDVRKMRFLILINAVSALQYCLWAKGMRECDKEETLPQLPCIEKKIPNQKQAVLKWLKYTKTVKANEKNEPCCRYNDFWALMASFAGMKKHKVYTDFEALRYKCIKMQISIVRDHKWMVNKFVLKGFKVFCTLNLLKDRFQSKL